MDIWEKICYSEHIYNKNYLKAEKKFNTKESFRCFYNQYFACSSL